ncbi:8713_t:CDS:2 [Entrophospora sp. SA101]|nr:8713_t:CDS:2 [Entrophospora sp. SA101]
MGVGKVDGTHKERAFDHLFEELKIRTKVIKLTSSSSEKTRSHIIFPFLAAASSLYNGDFSTAHMFEINNKRF